MAGVIRDLMLALWAHIQPHPYPHGTKVCVSAACLFQEARFNSLHNIHLFCGILVCFFPNHR